MSDETQQLFDMVQASGSKADLEKFKLLFARSGRSPSTIVLKDKSLLRVAITSNNLDIIQFLIEQGVELNTWEGDVGRSSPLGFACQLSQLATVKLLIALGANVNLLPDCGASPPICKAAGLKNRLPVLQYLLSEGADITLCSLDLQGNPSGNALSIACIMGNLEGVRLLVSNGADPNIAFPSGTPLARAVEEGHYEIVQLLMKQGADPNLTAPTNAGFPLADKTALEIARLKRRKRIENLISESSGQISKATVAPQVSIGRLISEIGWATNPGARRSSISSLESEIGFMPKLLVELLTITNGEPDDSDGLFPHPSGDELDGRFHLMSTDQLRGGGPEETGGAIPFAYNGLGDYLCYSSSSKSENHSVSIYEHEVGKARVLSDSFEEWIIETLQSDS